MKKIERTILMFDQKLKISNKPVVFLILILSFLTSYAHAYSFPFEEKFEGENHKIHVIPDSGWQIKASDDLSSSHDSSNHLSSTKEGNSSNLFKKTKFAEFDSKIKIDPLLSNPCLSFWYKSDLNPGERVYLEAEYKVKIKFMFWEWEETRSKQVADFSFINNTKGFYKWKSFSLKKFKGKDIKLIFKQRDASSEPVLGCFIFDDIRVNDLNFTDSDSDGIPDDYDLSPYNEKPEAVKNLKAEYSGGSFVELSWNKPEDISKVAGYRIYRKRDGGYKFKLQNKSDLISPETTAWFDTSVKEGKTYQYYAVAVSIEGIEGELPAENVFITISYEQAQEIPFVEDFDKTSSSFVTPEEGGWGVSFDHSEWTSFSGTRHLDSNPGKTSISSKRDSDYISAMMNKMVHIPSDAQNPAVSFWYKYDLSGLSGSYFDDWNFFDYIANAKFIKDLYTKNKVTINIHYKKNINGIIIEGTDLIGKTYDAWPKVSKYTWDSISLKKYRGMDVCVIIKQETASKDVPGKFIIDDFRITDLPDEDSNGNGIPDEYENPANLDILPFPKNFKVESLPEGPVKISWVALDKTKYPELKGYDLFRKSENENDYFKLNQDIISHDNNDFNDDSVENNTSYSYYLNAVNADDEPGYKTDKKETLVTVDLAEITEQPADLTITERESAELKITASGSGLKYTWFKDGEELPDSDSDTLLIEEVTLENAGEYHCVIKNFAGEIESDHANLNVEIAVPEITKQPENVETIERGEALFTLEYIGTDVEFQWYKNSKPIKDATASELKLESVLIEDNNSEISCILKNNSGSIETDKVILKVNLAAPEITKHPENKEVDERKTAEFNIEYSGSLVKIQWQKDGIAIPGANKTNYTTKELSLIDNDSVFTCVVKNDAGSITSNKAVLKVKPALPIITKHPENKEVLERKSVEFKIEYIGTNVEFQWNRNGQPINGANESAYKIDSVDLLDNGTNYSCKVSNNAGSVTSDIANLKVLMAAPVITSQPANIEINENEKAEFKIEYSGSDVKIQWYKNDEIINGAESKIFSIDSVTLDDNNTKFHCKLTNNAGSITSSIIELKVKLLPPVITLQPVNVEVKEKEPAEFKIDFTGTNATIQWQRNGENIPGATSKTYKIEKTDYLRDHNSKFKCIITNNAGSITSNEATLKVEELAPPVITTQPVNIEVNEGEKAEFKLEATGTDLSYQWQLNSTDIPGAVTNTYTIDKTSYFDNNKRFKCIIKNSGGTILSNEVVLKIKDVNPPNLTIHSSYPQNVTKDLTVIRGEISDSGSGIKSIKALNDQFGSTEFSGVLSDTGSFEIEIPLKKGSNNITIKAYDKDENISSKTILVNFVFPKIPIITITSHQDSETVNLDKADIKGYVNSELSKDKIRIELAGNSQTPTGSNGEYHFEFKNISLVEGANSFTITAKTEYGNSAKHLVIYYEKEGEEPPIEDPPVVNLESYSPEVYFNGDDFVISGTATTSSSIESVKINNEPINFVGQGSNISFGHTIKDICSTGETAKEIKVTVTDINQKKTEKKYLIICDYKDPEITIENTDIKTYPQVSQINESPYIVKGHVIEKNIAGASINGEAISLETGDSDSKYKFAFSINLEKDQQKEFVLDAWDFAGNTSSKKFILKLNTSFEIEIIKPTSGQEIESDISKVDVEILAKITGLTGTEKVTALIDETYSKELSQNSSMASGVINIDVSENQHKLEIVVKDENDNIKFKKSTTFYTIDNSNKVVELIKTEPSNEEINVEPNEFIALYFNRKIDANLLKVEVFETAHGEVYKTPESGAGLTELGDIRIVNVARNNEKVDGGFSNFPDKIMTVFYPKRDFAYSGDIYVNVSYNNEILSRFSFKIREIPTFVQGFVSDHTFLPIQNIKVSIPKIGKSAVTNKDGQFSFGYGKPAKEMIPPGRYKLIINPDLKDIKYGSIEKWINIEKGRVNDIGNTPVPYLNPKEPFRQISSESPNEFLLASDELSLNLSNSKVIFENGDISGPVHAQFIEAGEIAYKPVISAAAPWYFSINPSGVTIDGDPQIKIKMPKLNDSYNYIDSLCDYVVLTGLDPTSLRIVPIGVGVINRDTKRITSAGKLHLKRLDIIGYTMTSCTYNELMGKYITDEISIQELTGKIESDKN